MTLEDVPGIERCYGSLHHDASDSVRSKKDWCIVASQLHTHTGVAVIGPDTSDVKVQIPLSAEVPLAFGQTKRKRLGIPVEAATFRWAYPMRPGLEVSNDPNNEDHVAVAYFLELGGFLYFGKDHKLLQVKTVAPTKTKSQQTLNFKKHQWNPDWTQHLLGRFHPITVETLIEVGAKYFVWLHPNERIKDASGTACTDQPEIPHGGFAYIFHELDRGAESPAQGLSSVIDGEGFRTGLDCYFAVSCFDAFPTKQSRRSDLNTRQTAIHEQVKYYLTKDEDFRNQMSQADGGWLPLCRILRRRQMQTLVASEDVLVEALQESAVMQVSPHGTVNGRSVRLKPPLPAPA